MIKNVLMFVFIVVFTIFALDYFKLLPNDKLLGFNNVSNRQMQEINSFSMIEEKEEVSKKFTDRVVKNNK